MLLAGFPPREVEREVRFPESLQRGVEFAFSSPQLVVGQLVECHEQYPPIRSMLPQVCCRISPLEREI
ncbi:uncharacterized protein METZ01_LOCUS56759 [marine metagenome]|uniref:Uncharacterized protein n=1 Tax=marine metagenome TaxID=408172 RepID=A0A381SIP0_9ZZZZ